MRYISLSILATAFLVSCASAEQQPAKRWEVKVKTEGEPKVWVWKYDGSKQCDTPAKITPESAAQALKRQGVMGYQFQNGSDGRMYPSVCGAGTGSTIELEIARLDLAKAQRQGFQVKSAEN